MHSSLKLLPIIAFILLGLGVLLGIFFLFFWRISVVYGLAWKIRTTIILSIIMMILFVGSFLLSRVPGAFAEIVATIILWSVYCIWIVSLILLLQHILSLWIKIPTWTVSTAMVAVIVYGFLMGSITKVTPLTITTDKIPHDLNIVFISDLHVEYVHSTRYIQNIVNKINQLKPDLVLIGGDLLNIPKASYIHAFKPFNQLKMPVFATLGNHDAIGDQDVALDIFATTKIIPLRNISVKEQGIQLVGIDDRSYWKGKNLTGILTESMIASGFFTILVSHQPQHLSKLNNYPIDLELAGHTHNGQFIPMTWLIGLFNDYRYGKYTLGEKTAFVSQGIGTWGAPIRVGTQSELVNIILKKITP